VSRKRLIWIAGASAVAVAAIIGIFWVINGPVAYARIATGFAAQQTCACLHVSNRTLDSCVAEFPEDARRQFELETEGDIVRASVLGGAIKAEARYEERFGCTLRD
jgi:hypothetical protein